MNAEEDLIQSTVKDHLEENEDKKRGQKHKEVVQDESESLMLFIRFS